MTPKITVVRGLYREHENWPGSKIKGIIGWEWLVLAQKCQIWCNLGNLCWFGFLGSKILIFWGFSELRRTQKCLDLKMTAKAKEKVRSG